MSSTTRTAVPRLTEQQSPTLRWRSWPWAENRRWSWLILIGIATAGGFVWFAGGDWLLALAAMCGLAATLWQYLLPVDYEITPLGLRRSALRRTRLVPWHAVRAYQPRATCIVLYQRPDPTYADMLHSLFVPNPPDEDELHCAVRQHLPHAVQLPQ